MLEEETIPVCPAVRGACELLGIDPLHVACEGRMVVVVAPESAEAALTALRSHPLGSAAAVIGRIDDDPPGRSCRRPPSAAPASSTRWSGTPCRESAENPKSDGGLEMNEPRESQDAGRFEGDEHGYSPDVGRASEEVSQAGDRAWDTPPEEKEPGREVSQEERQGVSSTDTEPEGPFGVGVSASRRAEEIASRESEEGRRTTGVEEKTGRPYGTSAPEDATGVDPQETVEEDSPHIPPGDTS
ncbi:AIR synthase-related protein [Streptosporangium sp. CA-135522]|uniref:AIR synthase-related protein n=1 Tax=Streptosporangium sp. CA-135522 TaxID=3240072 RepID=UPI003D8F74FD